MDQVKVRTEDLNSTASKVDDLALEYSEQYEALYKDVETLVSTGYSGPQGEAFKNQIEGFRDDFEKMRQLMEEYADHLRKAAVTYEQALQDSENKIASLQN